MLTTRQCDGLRRAQGAGTPAFGHLSGPSASASGPGEGCARGLVRGTRCRRPRRGRRRSTSQKRSVRTFVLDTSVLLSDPGALRRFAEHEVVLPVVVITELEAKRHHPELGFFARYGVARARRAARHPRAARRGRADRRGGRHDPRRAQPHRRRLPAVRLPARRQRHPDPRGGAQPRQRAPRRHPGLQGPADADQGLRRRPARRGVPRRAHRRLRPGLQRHGRARGAGGGARRAVRRRLVRHRVGPRPAVPHRPGAALRARYGARPGRPRQARPPRARRPRGVRHPRPLGRAADRPGDAARPGGRHRLPRWPRRHRQVGDGAVRRARGGPRAASAPEGRGVPAAVRRRRPGARLPARFGVGEDVALGAGGLRHPGRRSPRAR